MGTYAVIKNGKVINIIVWDGVENWVKPAGCTVAKADDPNIQDKFTGTGFIAPQK